MPTRGMLALSRISAAEELQATIDFSSVAQSDSSKNIVADSWADKH
jgi:hypothetical protein